MKLINDKITCNLSKNNTLRGQQGTNDCDDNSLYSNKTTFTTVFLISQ